MENLIHNLKIHIHTLLESFGHDIEFKQYDYKSTINRTKHPNIDEVVIESDYGVVKADILTFDGKSELADLYISFRSFTSSQHSVALGYLKYHINRYIN
jgi:hypothetical protein